MDKFNDILAAFQGGESLGASSVPCGIPDTGKDVGCCGEINNDCDDKVIIHLAGGIDISMPLEVAKMIVSAVSGGCENKG